METPPQLSFIGIVDFSQEARWIYMTDSVKDLLGYEPAELRGRPSLELVHPDEAPRVRQLHYETIKQDKAAVLVYLRMKHKDPYQGYILCAISRTVVHNVLVGSVSYASPGPKALHNASTAQEITIISPAPELEFRRWGDKNPMPPSEIPANIRSLDLSSPRINALLGTPSSPGGEKESPPPLSPSSSRAGLSHLIDEGPSGINYPTLPTQSVRTALILNRFSSNNTIMYCSNTYLLPPSCENRPFFDYVRSSDVDNVRSWIDVVKGWGVNERGQPSDGGFGFCKFGLTSGRRRSNADDPSVSPRQERPSRGSRAHSSSTIPARNRAHSDRHSRRGERERDRDRGPEREESTTLVDAILSAHSDGVMVILRRAT